MTREELFKWLETCPTQEWAAADDNAGEVTVFFPIKEKPEEVSK